MHDGTARSSFTSLVLRDITEKDDRDYQEELIECLGGTMYTGALSSCFPENDRTDLHGFVAGADMVRFQYIRAREQN